MRLGALALALFALFSACEPPPARHASADEAAASKARVELGEMRIERDGKGFRIHVDGAIEAPDGQRIGTLGADGRLLDTEGNVVTSLGEGGEVDLGGDGAAKVHIDDDGTMTITPAKAPPIEARIAEDGTLVTSNPNAEKLTITGANTPGKKRAAMLVLIAVTMQKQSRAPASAPSSEAPR
jgi:hypothetical protein